MKKLWLLIIILLPSFLQSFNSTKIIYRQQYNNKKWVSLFNGKNLDNWVPKIAGYKLGDNFGHTFRVENAILSTRSNEYNSLIT